MSTAVINFPTKVRTAKKQAWLWLPAVANLDAPTVVEYNAGIPVQCSIEADQFDYKVTVDTATSQRYCEEFESETAGRKKLDLGDIEVIADPQDPTSPNYAVAAAWSEEPTGVLVLRAGLAHDVPAATDQVLSIVVPVQVVDLGLRAPKPGDTKDFYARHFQLLVQGDPRFDVALS